MGTLQVRLSGWLLRRAFGDERGAQILEFALSLPLLMLFVVGIFDFSGALSLKQKLTAAARDAARVAAADPASDLAHPALPASVSDAWQAADNFLKSEKINDCGLSGATPVRTAGTLIYQSSATAGCPGTGLVLTINRGCVTSASLAGAATDVVDTCVTIQYAYKWRFTSVSSVVGGGFIPPSNITTAATAFNEN
jgi:Flp pilus assembly protein TadG